MKSEIIARRKNRDDIVLRLDGKFIIERYQDDIQSKERYHRRIAELKQQKREIIHEDMDSVREPKKKLRIVRKIKILGTVLKMEED